MLVSNSFLVNQFTYFFAFILRILCLVQALIVFAQFLLGRKLFVNTIVARIFIALLGRRPRGSTGYYCPARP